MGLDWVLVVEEGDGTASRSGHEHQQLSLVSAEKQVTPVTLYLIMHCTLTVVKKTLTVSVLLLCLLHSFNKVFSGIFSSLTHLERGNSQCCICTHTP